MSSTRQSHQFGNFMEDVYGFAQSVKVGDTVFVSGQTAFLDDGSIDGEGDMTTQMRRAYANIARALAGVGATMDDVVDETLFVTDIDAASGVAHEVRKEAYGGRLEVASTLCQVAALGAPQLLIEIKCTAKV
jgi:2-iminobutanoate/2-iminopropanoate deaminase